MLADVFKHMMQRSDDPIGPDDAQRMAAEGRGGDTLIAHINPREAAILKALGGSGTINPKTGALEFMPSGDDSGNDLGGLAQDVADSYGSIRDTVNSYGGLGGSDPGNRDLYSGSDWTGGSGSFGLGGFVNQGGPYSGDTPNWGRGGGIYGTSAGSFVTPSYGGMAQQTANMFNGISDIVGAYGGPQGANLTGGLYSNPGQGAGDTSGFDYNAANNVIDQYAGPLGAIAGSGLYSDAGTGGQGDQANPTSPTAVGGAATPAAGAIAPEASIGWNPLTSWQQSFAPDEQGAQQALAQTDQGETVYSNDEHAVANLRGVRDNTDYRTDGFNVPGQEESIGRGLGSITTVDPERPDATNVGWASPRGDGVISTWSGVGPANFGIGDPDRLTNAATRQDPNAPNMGSMPTDAFGARVPEVTNNYRSQSEFSSPMADAMSRAYAQNPNLPSGYLEGMYGIESGYGTNMHSPGSSYYGPMQFSADSMAYAAPQLGPISQTNLYDPYDNMQALQGEFANMQRVLGRNPTAEEAYAMHQQGVTGAARAINDPYASFTDLGTPARNVTANGLPADANYRDFIERFGTPFGQRMDYRPDVSVQGPVGLGSMFR